MDDDAMSPEIASPPSTRPARGAETVPPDEKTILSAVRQAAESFYASGGPDATERLANYGMGAITRNKATGFFDVPVDVSIAPRDAPGGRGEGTPLRHETLHFTYECDRDGHWSVRPPREGA